MKFFTASYFFHTFVTETAGERPACNHAGCEAGLEESTLLQLAQFKNKANSSQTKNEVEETSLLAKEHHSRLIDQRIISGLRYMESHREEPMTNWRACLDKVGDPQMHMEKGTFDDLTSCFDAAEKADGIKEWFQSGQSLSLTALNASHGAPLDRQGHNCWGSCGHRAGSCSWCGSEGACCRRGYRSDPAECGNNGGDGYHMCTLRVDPDGYQDRTQGLLRHAGADCWQSCGRSGSCNYCGSHGACCRQGWGGSGCAHNVGGRDYHMCVWDTGSSVVHRARLPSYCENDLPSSHECSCAAVNWRNSQYMQWEYYQHNWGPQVGLVGQGRMAAVARCGFICPTHARWHDRGWVRAGTVWTTEYGFTTSDGWEVTSSTEREISDTMSMSMGFEFEGIGFGSEAQTTVTTRESLTTAMSGSTENEMRRGEEITWSSPGNVWQARSTTRDTCGGTLSILTKTFSLTPSVDNRPRCLPGRCNEHNEHGYCCTCHGGSRYEIPDSAQCQPRSCAIEATVDYAISGRDGRLHTITFEPGIEIQHNSRTSFPCSNAGGFTGDVTVECMYGGLAVVGTNTNCAAA